MAFTLLVLCLWAASYGQRESVSEDMLGAAIHEGWHGNPVPYDVLWRNPVPYDVLWRMSTQKPGRTVVGAAYTPFVRVAMWTQRLRDSGADLPDPNDVPRRLLDPTVTIALRREPSCCPPMELVPPVRIRAALVKEPGRLMLLCAGDGAHHGAIDIAATDDLSALELFDPGRIEQASALVTVPLERVRSGWDIVFETHWRRLEDGGLLHQVGFLTIRDSDVASWR